MKNITIISFTKKGGDINKRLTDILSESNITSYTLEKYRFDNRVKPLGNLKETVKRHFTDDAVIFIGAVGIAVRSIAPYIKDKFCDPAVLVIDEFGRYVIPLLSGQSSKISLKTGLYLCGVGNKKLSLLIKSFLIPTIINLSLF